MRHNTPESKAGPATLIYHFFILKTKAVVTERPWRERSVPPGCVERSLLSVAAIHKHDIGKLDSAKYLLVLPS